METAARNEKDYSAFEHGNVVRRHENRFVEVLRDVEPKLDEGLWESSCETRRKGKERVLELGCA